MTIEIHLHALGNLDQDEEKTFWRSTEIEQRQKNMWGEKALEKLLAHVWAPVQPDFADAQCTEIRFV
jgi:hypothetical protein